MGRCCGVLVRWRSGTSGASRFGATTCYAMVLRATTLRRRVQSERATTRAGRDRAHLGFNEGVP